MEILGIADFSETVGEVYELSVENGSIPLRLERVTALPPSGSRQGDCFRLELAGPLEPLLPQATYVLTNRDRRFEIFIVPVARTADAIHYEAIFN